MLSPLFRRAYRMIIAVVSLVLSMLFVVSSQQAQAVTPPTLVGSAQFTEPYFNFFANGSGTMAQGALVSWSRLDVIWYTAEPPTEPSNLTSTSSFNFTALEATRVKVQTMINSGITPLVIVQQAPVWARETTPPWSKDYPCSAIKTDAQDKYMKRFGLFTNALATNWINKGTVVKYWSIWNEEDFLPPGSGIHEGTGCWGDATLPYYGGGKYAKALSYVYDTLHAAYNRPDKGLTSQTVKVVLGGLALTEKPTGLYQPGDFFEGVLRYNWNGGSHPASWPYFDVVDIHAYPWFSGVDENWDIAPAWPQGMFLQKLEFIRSLLQQFNVHKDIMVNETGLMCVGCPAGPYTKDRQGTEVTRTYLRALANAQHSWGNLLAVQWWPFNWCDSQGSSAHQMQLLDACDTNGNGPDGSDIGSRPAYNNLQFVANFLYGATYQGSLSQGTPTYNPPLEGYKFYMPSRNQRMLVYWRNDGCTTCTIPTPAGTISVMTYRSLVSYGTSGGGVYGYAPTPGSTIPVGFTPVVVFTQ
jgi:hypothetical protein